MNSNMFFLLQGIVGLFLCVYMYLNSKKYRDQGFDFIMFLFLIILLKSAVYYFFQFNTIDYVDNTAAPEFSNAKLIPDPYKEAIYAFKLFIWRYLELLLPIAYGYFFVIRMKIAQYREDLIKYYRAAFIISTIGLSAVALVVIIPSLMAGSSVNFQTDIAWIEKIKNSVSVYLFSVAKIVFLIIAIRYVNMVTGISAFNIRIISNFRRMILFFLVIDLFFAVITWIANPFMHVYVQLIQLASIIILAIYSYGVIEDVVAQGEEKIENLAKERHLIISLIKKISVYIGSQNFSMGTVAEDILDSAVKVLNASCGALFLIEMEGNKKVLRANFVHGLYPPKKRFTVTTVSITESAVQERVKHEIIGLDEGLIGEVGRTGQSVFIPDTKKNSQYEQTLPDMVTITSFMAVPLISQDEVFGVLAIASDMRQFQHEDFSLLEILANFDHMAHTINQFSLHMNELVAAKTAEVESLLEQQHGDYYLTSLLVKPLVVNNVQSSRVRVDFFIDQKKKFKFRKWNAEIGGDICIAYTVSLKGSRYTVFTNADAMGKSIQGAGGALVYGVGFISHVMRTLMLRSDQELTPRDWLERVYRDLQTIFESFDGSMLMSGVIGMIHDESGKMWHFNCEHPWTIIYRNGAASFLETDEKVGRKLGTIGYAEMVVQENQLKPGDVIILGSDGRDDVMLGTNDETGNRIINEDEKMILRHVEKGEGSLQEIADSIMESGELTDDLSLVRIRYSGEVDSEITQSVRDVSTRFKEVLSEALNFYKNGEYTKGRKILGGIENSLAPGDDSFKFYHLLGNIAYKEELYDEALTLWNRALENSPENDQMIKNIQLLQRRLADKRK